MLRFAFMFVFSFVYLVCFGQVGNTPSDFSSGNYTQNQQRQGNPNTQDTIDRPKLSVRSISLELNGDIADIDTNVVKGHRIEPYYKNYFLTPNHGSENSAGISPYQGVINPVGLDIGYYQYDHLLQHIAKDRAIEVNRSLWNLQYLKGYNINSSNLNVGFYRRFARNILLNFDYQKYSDDSWLDNQSNEIGAMDIKLYQDLGEGRRKSYVHYSNIGIDEANSRTLTKDENGVSNLSNTKFVIGNKMVLRDSIWNDKTIWLKTEIGMKKHNFSFSDASVSTNESVFYSFSDLTTVELAYDLNRRYIENQINIEGGDRMWSAGLTVNGYAFSQAIDTMSFTQIDLFGGVDLKFSDEGMASSFIELALIDGGGDIEWINRLSRRFGRYHLDAELVLQRLQPTLHQRVLQVSEQRLYDNDFSALYAVNLSAHISRYGSPWDANLKVGHVWDAVLFDQQGLPYQEESPYSYITADFTMPWSWRWIEGETGLQIQHITTDRILRPAIQIAGSLEIDFKLFKRQLASAIGMDYYVLPSYDVPSYQPLLGAFYNDYSGAKSGNIVILNPYFTLDIDKFHFYLKTNNSLSRLTGTDLSYLNGYNVYDFRVAFGVNWTLLD